MIHEGRGKPCPSFFREVAAGEAVAAKKNGLPVLEAIGSRPFHPETKQASQKRPACSLMNKPQPLGQVRPDSSGAVMLQTKKPALCGGGPSTAATRPAASEGGRVSRAGYRLRRPVLRTPSGDGRCLGTQGRTNGDARVGPALERPVFLRHKWLVGLAC